MLTFLYMSLTVAIFNSLLQVNFPICAAEESLTKISRAGYGRPCNKSNRCDSTSFLSCRNSVCECYKEDSMFYDPIIKSCLVLVGEKCRFPLTGDNSEAVGYIPPEGRAVEEELDCVRNAWCNHSGLCVCSGDYLELSNGTCIPPRNFEESCISDKECRHDRFLRCIHGRCECNETSSVYNVLLRQCVGKVGQSCLGVDGCVYNADCATRTVFSPVTSHRRTPTQYVKTCSCRPGFIADPSGFCKVGLGGQCSQSKVCSDNFKCKDGECVCKFPELQLAILRSQTCLSLVGGPCNETIYSGANEVNNVTTTKFQCIDNARCTLTSDTLFECKCVEGFVENMEGTCDLAFGANCNVHTFVPTSRNTDGISSWNQDLSCDRVTPLYCIDGVCQCESSLYEYDGNRACLGKYGAKCKPSTEMKDGSSNSCISGAICTAAKGSKHGKCICSSGFSASRNRTCLNG